MAKPTKRNTATERAAGMEYLPVQRKQETEEEKEKRLDAQRAQTTHEKARATLSMTREQQKAQNREKLQKALERNRTVKPADPREKEAMAKGFAQRKQQEEYQRRYATPTSSKQAREQYQWNKQRREAQEQYQTYFEQYAAKPTEEQVKDNPVLSDIGQLWKANTTQVQQTQKALEEIENTRIPGQEGRKLFMAARNANTIAPMQQARDREQPQLSEEDQAFATNAYNTLKALYAQKAELEAKGDAAGLAEVNKRIANEETILNRLGVPLPEEVAETVEKYALGGSKDLETYLNAKRNVELMEEEIALGGVIAPEENKAYQDLKARVEHGEELTGQDYYDYKVWSEQYGAYERDKETIKTLEDAGVLESGYSYAEQERQRRNEGQLTQIEALSQYAGTIQAPIAKQEASKLMTELYNRQDELEKDIAAMERSGITGAEMDNAKEQLAAVERQIAEGEYAMLRFADDFFTNAQPGAGAGKKGSVYHVVNATEEELARLRARGAGQSVMPVRSGVADAIAGLSGQELNALRMTDMERQTYNYLHNTKGAEAADAYFKSLEPRLLKRQAEMQQGVWKTLAEHPVGAFTTTAATFPMTLVEGLGAVKTGVDNMLGRETSPYDTAFAPTRFKSTVRETVKAGQREAFGDGLGGDIANLAYDVVTTFFDSSLSMAAGGATGGSALMALSATSGKTQQELLLGRDSSRALVQGLAAGAVEALSEKMGMDRLTEAFSLGKRGGYRTILANMIKGFAPEALEELPGNVVDRALDNYLNGDSSQRAESIKQKIAAGMSATQATVETDMEFVVETLQGMLVGGLSGSLGAGIFTSVGVIKTRTTRRVLTEAGVDAKTAQAAAERMAGLRSDAAGKQALQDAMDQLKKLEKAKGVKHTPFAAEATAAGYEDVPVKVTGFQGIRDGEAWVEIEIAGKGKGEIRLDQVRFADTDTQAAYNRAAMFEDTETARRFLAGYENTSLPLEIYGKAFQSAYQAGQNSRAMTEYERKEGFGAMLEEGVYRIAYQAGQEATAAQEARLALPASLGKAIRRQLEQLPRTYTQGYTGVVYAAKNTQPTKAQAVMLAILDDYAKAHGVHYTVVDSIGDGSANGVYTTAEGMVVALDAEEGYLTRVATHEGWHYIRQQMGQEAQDLQDVVLELLQNTEGYDLESRVKEKQEQYKQIKGQELSREEALDELTADALYDAIATPEALGAFVSRAYENATSKRQKNAFVKTMDQVMDFVKRFVGEVKALARKMAGKNPEARAMLEHEADWGESIIQEYNRLMEEAGKREAQQQGNGQAQKENAQTRYSTKAQDQLIEDKYFQRAIDAWDGTSSGGRVKIGVIRKGGIYAGIGLPDGMLYMDYTKLAKAMSKHGDHLSKNILKQIPRMLASPVVITQPINPHVKNTVNVFGDLMGDNGKPIMVSIMMRPDRTGTYLIDVIRTVEMRSDAQKLITDQSVLYLSENKKRTTDWFQGSGNINVPFAGTKSGFIRSISYESENNNNQGENFPNAENSNAQKNFSLKNVGTDKAEQRRRQGAGSRGAKHTPFAAEATAAGYEDVALKVTGFQGIRDGAAWVEIEIAGKGKGEIRLDQVRFADTDTQAAYKRAAMFGDTETARRFLAGYESTSLPLEIYGKAFQSAYQAGQNSRAMRKYERKAGLGAMLEEGVYRIAYQAGQEATAAQNARLAVPESLGKAIRRQLGQLPRTYTEGYTGVVYAAKTTRPTKAQAVMLSLLDGYAKAHGVHYTVVDSIGDGSANGVYTTAEGMVVALDAEEGYLTRVATHEGWHYIRQQMGQEAQDLQDVVLELLGNTEGYNLDSRVKEKQEQYKRIKGQELSREAALEELTADALYDAIATPEALRAFVSRAYENATSKRQKNAFVKTMDKVMAFINKFVGEVKALARKMAGKNPEARAMLEHEVDWGETIVQEYNRLMEEAGKRERGKDSDWYDYSKPFAQQVQDWIDGKIPERDTLLLGKTPELYRKIGLSNLPVTMDQTHVDYAINGTKNADHQLGAQLLKQLPQLLENPVAIIESGTRPGDSVMVIVQGTVQGKQICAPIWVSGVGRQNKIAIDSNRVTSVQGRKNAVTKLLAEAIQKENAGQPSVYYINKTEARSLYDRAGVQFPGGHLQDGLIHSIFDAGSPVNRKFMEQTQTRQFKRWFGDSKVVNADGSPKVMYHGTSSGAFTEFDPGHGGTKAQLDALGSGNYFTADRESARRQGTQVLEAYVSMQNPYIARSEGGLKRQMEREFGIKLASRRDIQGELQKRGYDGVILYEPGSDKEIQTAVAFEPTQIKSATDNVGTFDPQNPKINYALRNGDVGQTRQEDALQGDTAAETGELQAGENANDGENASSAENDDAQTENPYAYRVLTEKGDRTVVDVSDVGEITRDEAVQRGLENVRKYTDKTDRNGVPMMYVDDLGKYVTVGSKALHHGLDRRAQANSAVTAHIGDLLKQAIVINEADPKKENHTNTYILLSVARDSNQENVYVRMVVNQSTGQLEDVTSLYALNTKKRARRVVAPNGEVSPGVPAGSTMTIAEILENVKDIYSDVLSKDVLKALGMEKRSESELTQRLRYALRNGDVGQTRQEDALQGDTAAETGELQAGENANDGENASSAENDDAQTENLYAYRVLTEKGDRTVVDVSDVGEITRDEAVQRGLENVRKYTDKTDRNGVPMMYVDDLGKYVTVGSKALHHGLDRRVKVNGAATAHIGDLLKQAIVINEADPKKENHTNTYILLSVAQDSNQENVYVRMVVNQSTGQLEDVTSLYALNTKNRARRVVAPNGEVSLGVPAGSTMTVAEILENVKDIYSDVLSKDVLKALGMEKRSESELTQRLRYALREGGMQAAAQGSMGALEGATVENHAGIYAAQREKLAGWADGKPRSAEAVRELLGESMTPTLEKWLHNQYEKGQNRQVKEPVRREAVEAFLKRDEEQIAANEEKSKAFWQKLRGEKVRVHEVEVGEHTHEGRGAMGRQIVQALMGDAPRVTVHNRDAQVDIYVNRASVEKTLSYGGSKNIPIEVSKAILLQTKEMLADAKYIGSREDYTGNGGQVHYFVSAAQTGDDLCRVVYMAHETTQDAGQTQNKLYVEEVELLDTENTGVHDTSRPQQTAHSQPLTSNHPGTISIPELLQNYNTEFLRRYDLKERGAKRALQYSLREERTGVFTEIADRELREAGIDGRTARKAAERLGGLREDSAGNEALQAVKWRLWQVERDKRGSHTPFAARALVNGYEEEPVTVTGMKTVRNGEAYVEIDGKGRARLEQVRFRDKENERVYREAARYERLKTARKFLGGYEAAGLPAELYGKAFRSAYDAGARSGRPGSRRRKLGYGGLLDVEVYRLAYEAGREESEEIGAANGR